MSSPNLEKGFRNQRGVAKSAYLYYWNRGGLEAFQRVGRVGCRFVLIHYANLYQFVRPPRDDKISVAIEQAVEPLALVGTIERKLADLNLA